MSANFVKIKKYIYHRHVRWELLLHADTRTGKDENVTSLLATASRVRRKRIQLIALCFFYRVQNLRVKRTCLFFSMLLMFSSLRTLESTFCYIV